jgi:hypothetical protein
MTVVAGVLLMLLGIVEILRSAECALRENRSGQAELRMIEVDRM